MREARIMEQTNNPNYLKPAKKRDTGSDYQNAVENYDDIPIAEIALEVPLQIHCEIGIGEGGLVELVIIS